MIDVSKFNLKGEFALPIAVLCLLAMIVLPLPPIILDIFFTLNIVVAILILAKSVNVDRPLAFTTFPAIILIATLLRLAMNVASTRVILLEGHNGPDAAGSVISAFGDFVIGGQYFVGLIVFAILVIINFIVITKGTGRVSEVSARFKLDALPGKQMAIDADMNTGSITSEEAREKREELTQEADFYGAMDGASKFVKGDAVAGIVILLINIVGGLALGVATHDLTFSQAAESYVLLTIGDGIVAQIPGLILSVATGIIITRAGKHRSLGEQVKGEFLTNGKNFYATGMVLFVLGAIPGMPNIAFLTFAFAIAALGYAVDHLVAQKAIFVSSVVDEEVQTVTAEVTWKDIEHVKPIEVKVGFGLVDWVQKDENELINRLKGLRKRLSQDLGFLVSPISVQDDLNLPGFEYVVYLHGEEVSRFTIYPSKLLAVGTGVSKLRGQIIKEPAFGIDAQWIEPSEKGKAETFKASVINPDRVLTTHLSEVIGGHISTLFGFDEAKKLLEKLSDTAPHLVEEFDKKVDSIEVLVKVMKCLLEDGIPLKDVKNILRVVVENYQQGVSHIVLAQYVRNAFGRTIVNKIFKDNDVEVIAMDSKLQEMLVSNVINNGVEHFALEANLAHSFCEKLQELFNHRSSLGLATTLVVDENIRWQIKNTLGSRVVGLHVMAVQELPSDVDFEIIETLSH